MSVIGLVSMEDLGVSNHEDERRTLDVVGRDGQAFVRVSFGLWSRVSNESCFVDLCFGSEKVEESEAVRLS